MKSIELLNQDGPEVIHADGRHPEFAKAVMDFAEQWLQVTNNAGPDKMACGGCISTLVLNMAVEMVNRADLGHMAGAVVLGRLAIELRDTAMSMAEEVQVLELVAV